MILPPVMCQESSLHGRRHGRSICHGTAFYLSSDQYCTVENVVGFGSLDRNAAVIESRVLVAPPRWPEFAGESLGEELFRTSRGIESMG